jgi:hypothetical protein
MTYPDPDSNVPDAPKATGFLAQVTPLLPNLLYPSESDEPIEAVETYLKMAGLLTASHIKDWLMLPPSVYVEEIPEADFWSPVTTIEDWYEEEERTRAEQFQQLQTITETTLTNRQIFRVGDVEIDVYLLGKPADGPRVGLKTRVVET